jgi:uncharacterized cupin superfamily protein
VPHRHDNSSELFYILDGAFDLLVGEEVVTARTGDLLGVPPGVAHAFAAHRGSTAEALIIATPGIERFDYFRHVVRRREGSEPTEVLLGLQGPSTPIFSTAPPGSASVRRLDRVRSEKARGRTAVGRRRP